MEKVRFEDIRQSLQTGDLIFFSGEYAFSKVIEFIEDSPWSHVGMVIRLPGDDNLYLFESTSLVNLEDELYHDRIKGPKVVDLYDRLSSYGKELVPYKQCDFGVRKANFERTEETHTHLFTYIHDTHGIPTPDEWEMCKEVIEGKILNKADDNTFIFCSELVAETYMAMGVLNNDHPGNFYTPKDMATQTVEDHAFCSFGDVMELLI